MEKKKKRVEYQYESTYEEFSYQRSGGIGVMSLPITALQGIGSFIMWLMSKTWRFGVVSFKAMWRWSMLLIKGTWHFTTGIFVGSLNLTFNVAKFCWRLIFGGAEKYDLRDYDEYGNLNYEAIRRRIGRRFRRRGRFAIHAGISLLLNAWAWLAYATPYTFYDYRTGESFLGYNTNATGYIAFTLLTLVILGIHAVNLFIGEAEERALDREVERLRRQDAPYRERQMRLSDDGEILYMDEHDGKSKRELQYGE